MPHTALVNYSLYYIIKVKTDVQSTRKDSDNDTKMYNTHMIDVAIGSDAPNSHFDQRIIITMLSSTQLAEEGARPVLVVVGFCMRQNLVIIICL